MISTPASSPSLGAIRGFPAPARWVPPLPNLKRQCQQPALCFLYSEFSIWKQSWLQAQRMRLGSGRTHCAWAETLGRGSSHLAGAVSPAILWGVAQWVGSCHIDACDSSVHRHFLTHKQAPKRSGAQRSRVEWSTVE